MCLMIDDLCSGSIQPYDIHICRRAAVFGTKIIASCPVRTILLSFVVAVLGKHEIAVCEDIISRNGLAIMIENENGTGFAHKLVEKVYRTPRRTHRPPPALRTRIQTRTHKLKTRRPCIPFLDTCTV